MRTDPTRDEIYRITNQRDDSLHMTRDGQEGLQAGVHNESKRAQFYRGEYDRLTIHEAPQCLQDVYRTAARVMPPDERIPEAKGIAARGIVVGVTISTMIWSAGWGLWMARHEIAAWIVRIFNV